MIVGEIRRYLRDNSALRISRSLRDTAYKVLQAKEKLMAQSQREPTEEEISRLTGIPRGEIVAAMDAILEPVSLYEPVYSDSGDSVRGIDQISDTKNTDESWLQRIAIGEAIEALSPREKQILSMRYYEGRTQMQVASEIGISQAQVSRLEKNAINRIKRNI